MKEKVFLFFFYFKEALTLTGIYATNETHY